MYTGVSYVYTLQLLWLSPSDGKRRCLDLSSFNLALTVAKGCLVLNSQASGRRTNR